ncbi:MAG: RES family NAD+ phosphorylase, partial [Persicimonas sp.]
PKPPAEFADVRLPISEVNVDLWRIYRNTYDDPLYYDRSPQSRFNAPDASFGVCYLATDLHGAFIETFGRSLGTNLVTRRALEERSAVRVVLLRTLRLVDLTGEGAAQLGVDARLSSGGDYKLPQMWSKAIFEHPDAVDGIIYRSRHDQARSCVAVFDRSADTLAVQRETTLASPKMRERLSRVLEHYQFALG